MIGNEVKAETAKLEEPWALRTIGDTGKYINGLAFKPTDWGDEGMPIIRIQNLTNLTKPLNRTTRVVDSAYVVNPGDILVSWSATLDAFIWDREPGLLNQHIFKVVPDTSVVTKKFLFFTLKKAIAEMIKSEHLHGSTMKHINRGPFMAHKIEIPTLEQQDEIVAEIETQFSRLDEAVANLQRVKANLKRHKAAILKAAVEGRLVETEASLAHREGRSYETGEQLLKRILAERRAKWTGKGKYKEPVEADAAALGVPPEGWGTASLDMISTDSGYGTSQKCGYENDGPAVLRIPNVQHGVLDLQDLKFAPTDFKLGQSDAVSSGDMLIIRTNGSKSLIGRAAVVMAEPQQRMSFASYLIRFRLSNADCIPAWVSVVWQTSQIREWIEAHAATSAGQHNVNLTVLAKAAIPIPPASEQVRIVAEVDRNLSMLREVEAEVDANLRRAQALRKAILSKAFS